MGELAGQQTTQWTWKGYMAAVGLAGLYVGSQVPIYFIGGSLSAIVQEIGGDEAASWIAVAFALPLAAVAPFCGYMQDLVGRRPVTLFGGMVLLLGILLVGITHTFRQAIVGLCLQGAGAAMAELAALAGTAELVPVAQRGTFLAIVTASVLPFTPYVLYSQLLVAHSTWRWGMWICLVWVGISWLLTLLFYFPKSQTRATGDTVRAILRQIDYVGGVLSIVGVTLLLVALQAGGYDHPWDSAYVLCQLIIGLALLAAFVVWEWKFATQPMIPHVIFSGQRIVAMMLTVAFISGMDFYALVNFFPIQSSTVFPPDPVRVGLRALPTGLGITFGAVIGNLALSVLKGNNREIITAGCVIMTTFTGALAAVNPDREGLAIAFSCLSSIGVGMVIVPAITVVLCVVPDTVIATCVALAVSVRALGGAIGAAIYYNVLASKIKKLLPLHVAEWAVKAGLPPAQAVEFVTIFVTDPKNIGQVSGVTPEIVEAATIGSRWGYADAFRYPFFTSIAFGVCSIILAMFVGNIKRYMTDRVAARLD